MWKRLLLLLIPMEKPCGKDVDKAYWNIHISTGENEDGNCAHIGHRISRYFSTGLCTDVTENGSEAFDALH